MEIVYGAAKLIQAQANATSKDLGIDLVTEKPLLPDMDENYTKEDFERYIDRSAEQRPPKLGRGGK